MEPEEKPSHITSGDASDKEGNARLVLNSQGGLEDERLSEEQSEQRSPPFPQIFSSSKPLPNTQFLNEYFQIMGDEFEESELKSIIGALRQEKIHLDSTYSQSVKKKIVTKFNNSILFEVKIGYAFAQISLLKIHKSRKDLRRRAIASGSFSTIYGITIGGRDYAMKSQPIQPEDRATLNQQIDAVLREYTCSKIASTLGCGPRM